MFKVDEMIGMFNDNKKSVSEMNKYHVYALWDKGEIVYIGKSENVYNRINNHTKDKVFDEYSLIDCETEGQMGLLESNLIISLDPKYNKTVGSEFISIKRIRSLIRSIGNEYKYNKNFYVRRIRELIIINNIEIYDYKGTEYIRNENLDSTLELLLEGY